MKLALTAAMALSAFALAGCDRPATHSSTTVVKEPTVVQKEKETTVVQRDVPAPSSTTNVTIDAAKPTTESTRSTTTSRVDTPMGTATKTETTKTESTK